MSKRERDPFDEPIGDIPTPIEYQPYTECEPELFLDGTRFLKYIQVEFEFFDVITYSNSYGERPPLRRIRYLITNLPLAQGCPTRPAAYRIATNIHTKMFLCYAKDVLQCVYVGSQNLTHGTQLNLMIRVDYNLNQVMADYFDEIWRLTKGQR